MTSPEGAGRQVGSQTLARGLKALFTVVEAPEPQTIAQVAEALGAHRTIAYRILQTLAEYRLVARGEDGRYSAGGGLAALAYGFQSHLREVAMPILRDTADDLGSTIALIVTDGSDAVALAVVEPRTANYHITYRQGSRHPLDRGSAGYALLTLEEPAEGEPEQVSLARERGWARSKGEVEPDAWGVAVPVLAPTLPLRACLNVITYREDVADAAPERLLTAARQLADKLA